MIDRKFVDDGWDVADAIKNGGQETLLENFQVFWKERCANPNYLDEETTFRVLTRFAIDNFERIDWYTFLIDNLQKWFFYNRLNNYNKADKSNLDSIPRSELNNLILTTIQLMEMRYDDAERI